MRIASRRVMLLYWGRRGAMNRLTLVMMAAARRLPDLEAVWSVSRQSDSIADFEASGAPLLAVDTFRSPLGALLATTRLRQLRRTLAARIQGDGIDTVISLMPHVWSPLIVDAVRSAGARYATVVHDAVGHPGDRTSSVLRPWFISEAHAADHVVTLSRGVTRQLLARGIDSQRLTTLFLPDIVYGAASLELAEPATIDRPFRLLFLGRVMDYKGLPTLVAAVEQLRASGIPVTLGVYGRGELTRLKARLAAIDAEVVNRWIEEDEMPGVLSRFHAVALAHIEASQSGVAAAAMGAGLPVIALPVGGLVEQVKDGETGLLARGTAPSHLAASIAELATSPALHARLRQRIARGAGNRSPGSFLARLVDAVTVGALGRARSA
jgi:glycosyltransferase involved in cell wall biosynthesis